MLKTSKQRLVAAVRSEAKRCELLSDVDLKQHSLKLKYDAMRGDLSRNIADAFGLVTEAVRRHRGLTYFDVQIQGGIVMARGGIAEMKTGEGKTITAVLPAFYNGLSGLGCHVVTVNDYLAKRDFELLRPVYEALGMSVGVILRDQSPEERSQNYRCDVTYGTAKEFGFDFLRDRMKQAAGQRDAEKTQRSLNSVVIDEVDSVLLDEARTPLIIGTFDQREAEQAADRYYWAAQAADQFQEEVDFYFDEDRNQIELLPRGFQKMSDLPQVLATRDVSNLELKEHIERAISVRRNFQLDKNYAIAAEKVVIIDEFTGRPAEGRQWQGGIHQSIEAKEGLEISPKTESAASVTVQHYFRLYPQRCGMTGTGMPAKREFQKTYGMEVQAIPTNKPVIRQQLATRIFSDRETKFAAIVEETKEMLDTGRAVLIGTRSVESSEQISKLLQQAKVEHSVLNARYLEREAEIVSLAGQPAAVTVATNMAGRGTDILLHDDVRRAGGLHVLLSEIHESSRIDLQLIGRSSRQGDPGSYRTFVSMNDEILKLGLGETAAAKLSAKYQGMQRELPASLFRKFASAQRRAERKHLVDRMALLRREKDLLDRMYETGQDLYLDMIR